ncbi:EAL domain-containing protein [Parasulfuritortus cantonensis]|uniref:EAL domain-containing protein n=1 Tax=Parasulfuritortus cantonensis TaxID=2528202 RepID=A0A4V2NV08_9PROT|nr:EAL domain-containing protein [Parasulfuritortus cantonensis]TCJ11666.1 EAL domain-containing protein [Parasulfuritortus cantonensis]
MQPADLHRRLVAGIPDHIAVVGCDYVYLWVNDAYLAAHGRARAAIEGHHVTDLFEPGVFEAVIKPRLDRCFAGAEVHYADWFAFPVLGRRYMNVIYTPYRQDAGPVAGAIVCARDVTDQRLAQEALLASEANYRNLFENMLHGYAYCRLLYDNGRAVDYRFLVVNPAFENLTGLRDVVGHKVSQVIPGFLDSNPELFAAYDRVAQSGQPEKFETYVPGLDRWFSVSVYCPQPEHVVIVFDNVTDSRRTQRALENERERIRLLLDSMAEGMYGVDQAGVCTFVNKAGLAMLGYDDPGQVVGHPIHQLIHHHHADGRPYPPEACRVYQAYRHDAGVHIDDEVFWRRDGSAFPVEYWSYPLRQDGQVIGSVVTFLDISERRQGEARLFEATQMLKVVIDTVPHYVFWKDRQSRFLGANRAFARLAGLDDPAELVGCDDYQFHWRAYAALYQADDAQVMASETAKLNIIEPIDLEGETRWLETSKEPLRDPRGQVIGVVGIFRDVTERIRAEEKLRQAAKVFESTTEGVMITALDGKVIAVNQAFTDITGYSEAEVLGGNPRQLKSSRHEADFYRTMWQEIRDKGLWQGEIWNRRKSGEIYPEWLTINTVRDQAGRPINYVGVFSDISAVKQTEAKLNFLAHHDPLTELPNRMLFNDRLEHAIQRAKRESARLALLFIDLDQFKHVNDSLGHPIGDKLLCLVAQVLSASVRAEDSVARLGGDEFVVLLEGIADVDYASDVARKILAALIKPHRLDGHDLVVGASIGISAYPEDGGDAATLLRNADTAMYHSKAEGRNTFRYYSAELTRSARERLTLEGELRQAIERGEFELHYQPQVAVADGAIVGVEALVRWRHRVGGLISPARFIPLAEETGLIVPLGEWVLRTACAQFQAWRNDPSLSPFTLAVNLSPRQFRNKGLVQLVRAILEETGMPPRQLELEITEGAVMEQPEAARSTLLALKSLGIKLAIDDFGTGYSSLAYLRRFPINVLKIDQSFMRDIPNDVGASEIAATIIAMARNLNLKVLAEGVETGDQLAFLMARGCDYSQGYLHSRPLDGDAFAALLRGSPRLRT